MIQPAPDKDRSTYREIRAWGERALECLDKFAERSEGEGIEGEGGEGVKGGEGGAATANYRSSDAGFAVVGQQGGVGVFVWATDSFFNVKTGGGPFGEAEGGGVGAGDVETE